MSPAELRVREELAALYHLVARFRMTDLVDTHISARIPGAADHFLINPYGVLFHQVRPEDLVKIDPNGVALDARGNVDGSQRRINGRLHDPFGHSHGAARSDMRGAHPYR